jgi:hypothetical protein
MEQYAKNCMKVSFVSQPRAVASPTQRRNDRSDPPKPSDWLLCGTESREYATPRFGHMR